MKVDPNRTSSSLLPRTVFDLAEEDTDGKDMIDHLDELREDGDLEGVMIPDDEQKTATMKDRL